MPGGFKFCGISGAENVVVWPQQHGFSIVLRQPVIDGGLKGGERRVADSTPSQHQAAVSQHIIERWVVGQKLRKIIAGGK